MSDNSEDTGTVPVAAPSKPVSVDFKWINALETLSARIEPSASGHVPVVLASSGDVDAEATLRGFLELICGVRVAPDHSGHQVPQGTKT